MKRAVLSVANPQDYIPKLDDYSIMIINPNVSLSRTQYLLSNSDWSLYITDTEEKYRDGGDYLNERVLWYTSGTTGDSKFCSFSQAQLDNMAKTICNSYQLTANDRYVSVMSLWHAHGQGFYWATKLAGCDVKYLSVKELRHLPEYSPTFITAIPDLLRVVGELEFDSNLRFIRGASAALPVDLYRHLRYKFNIPIIEAFGMTEAMSHCFTNPLEGPQRIGTVGLPDGVDARIVDSCLQIRGFNVAYQGWYDTGDLAEQDALGYYKILGRSKDQINVKGVKLNPQSLEKQLLEAIPGLIECAIFGTDRVKCIYVGDCDKNAIVNFLIKLGNHCRPLIIEKVDAIPLTPGNKISRTLLNSLY